MKPTTSMLPSLIPLVAPKYYGGSGTGIVKSLSVNTQCMLQECAMDCDFDSYCARDLV